MSLRQNIVFRRLSILGVSDSEIRPIIQLIEKWVLHNGFDWTISRLKQFKVAYIKKIAGAQPEYDWISHTDRPRGPLGVIWKLNKPNKALNALMIYTDFVSPKLTEKQWKKFSSSAQQDNPSFMKIDWPSAFPKASRVYSKDSYEFSFPQRLQSFSFKNIDRINLKNIRTPQWVSDTFRPGENSAYNMSRTFRHELIANYIYDNYDVRNAFPVWFEKAIVSQYKDSREMIYDHDRVGDHVGRISFIQEPGYKLRAVANPVISLQIMLEPLKQFVMNALKVIPQDYCHNQDAAILNISHYLRDDSSHRLSSIDLSDATNNIPLTPQIELLETLLGPKHPQIELFRKVARGKWYVDSPEGETSITFNNGQPLGTGPSFGTFSLFHHFVARCAICNVDDEPDALVDFFHNLNQYYLETGDRNRRDCVNDYEPGSWPYWIVGDDIVIDQRYADSYMDLIHNYYKVPISMDKCLFNVRAAEFCSRVITPTSISHAFKWKTVSDNSFLHIAKSLGPKSLPLFRTKQQALLKKIAYIPDTIGGPVSWNPDGLPLGIREQLFWDDADKLFSSKNLTSSAVRSSDLTYKFYRDLKLILSFGSSPLDNLFPVPNGVEQAFASPSEIHHIDVVSDPSKRIGKVSHSRQREIVFGAFTQYLYDNHDSRNIDIKYSNAFLIAMRMFPDIHLKSLYAHELKSNTDWYHDQYFEHPTESNLYFEKLCNLFDIKFKY
jgi:hypothetical protein